MLDYAQDVLLPAARVDAELHAFVAEALEHTAVLASMARAAGDDATADEYVGDTIAELTHLLMEHGAFQAPGLQ